MIDLKSIGIFTAGSLVGTIWTQIKRIFRLIRSLFVVKTTIVFADYQYCEYFITKFFFHPLLRDKDFFVIFYKPYMYVNKYPLLLQLYFAMFEGFCLYRRKYPVWLIKEDRDIISVWHLFFLPFRKKIIDDSYKILKEYKLKAQETDNFRIEIIADMTDSPSKRVVEQSIDYPQKKHPKENLSILKWNAENFAFLYTEFKDFLVLRGRVDDLKEEENMSLFEKRKKEFENVYILPQWKELLEDVKFWIESEELYRKNRIIYKRGCLLWGKAGSGKSAGVYYVARLLNLPIYRLELNKIYDMNFYSKLHQLGTWKKILLVEDIDNIYNKRERVYKPFSEKDFVRFETFINAIDGVDRIGSFYLIITTNHPEKLDPALAEWDEKEKKVKVSRAGRIDKAIKFDYLDFEGKKFILNNLLKEVFDREEINKEIEKIKDEKMVVSEVVNYALLKLIEKRSAK